ncbi:MAG: hypothetical protein JNK72_18505 [Myxococcales bacterium]|nr:hypothetical protein [Myxococcales bacterium]
MRPPYPLALPLSLVLGAVAAWADPPPKVCVAVAGDPDEAVRALADDVNAALGSSNSLRAVADRDTREALRGGVASTAETAEWHTARRALRAAATDDAALDGLAERLGCAVWVTLATRPAGTALRLYDARQRRGAEVEVVSSLDAAAVVTRVEGLLAPSRAGGAQSNASRATASSSQAAVPSRTAAPTPRWRRAIPWVALGLVTAAVVGAFVVTQNPEPSSTRIQVISRGSE